MRGMHHENNTSTRASKIAQPAEPAYYFCLRLLSKYYRKYSKLERLLPVRQPQHRNQAVEALTPISILPGAMKAVFSSLHGKNTEVPEVQCQPFRPSLPSANS
jgi:hypothetical protein